MKIRLILLKRSLSVEKQILLLTIKHFQSRNAAVNFSCKTSRAGKPWEKSIDFENSWITSSEIRLMRKKDENFNSNLVLEFMVRRRKIFSDAFSQELGIKLQRTPTQF